MIRASAIMMLAVVAAAFGDEPVPIAPPPQTATNPAEQFEYLTSFEEGEPGRNAGPVNQTSVGIPGWPVMAIGHQMRLRYSEFEMRFRVGESDKAKPLYVLPRFRQASPGGWLPGAVTEFEHDGVAYRIGYVTCPSEPQPIDVMWIDLTNTAGEQRRGQLHILLDGAPTLEIKESVLADRGKPLAYLTPEPEKAVRIWRNAGVVDPRATPYGAWTPPGRSGWYGMPIEYKVKVGRGNKAQVFLGFRGTPQIAGFPPSRWPVPGREIIAEVEGDSNRPRIKADPPSAVGFNASDSDGDEYVSIAVKAAPESNQPAMLNDIWVFPPDAKIAPAELLGNTPPKGATLHIPVGADAPRNVETTTEGLDPTVSALSLDYTPELAPAEKKHYEIRLTAIDRPELQCYGNPYHPYDTGTSWQDSRNPRHPENPNAIAQDVPPGTEAATYAIDGPKGRAVWDAQLAAVKRIDSAEALRLVRKYWDDVLTNAARLDIPEPRIVDTYKHQLAMLCLHTLHLGDKPYAVMMGGPFFYWDFCYRDAAYEAVSLDVSGLHDWSRPLLNAYVTPRSKMPRSRWTLGQWDDAEHEGLWMTRDGQYDAQGQTLWALGEHAALTGDAKWLAANYEPMRRGAEWIVRSIEAEKRRLADPKHAAYGLLPEGQMEGTPWHHAYYFNAWAIAGLEETSQAATALKRADDARHYKTEAANLRKALRRSIQMSFRRKNLFIGSIPVNPEVPDDLSTWASATLIQTTKVLSAVDPLVDAAWKFREAEAAKQGGLMSWPYIYTDWAIGYIDRGEPDRCTQLFYTYLSLASGTLDWGEWYHLNKTFSEFQPPRVAAESCSDMPHSESCSNFILLFRSLILREVDDDLHIAPATPRKWLTAGQQFGISQGPSHFGRVEYQITAEADGKRIRARVNLTGEKRPARLVIHLRTPASYGLQDVSVNGKPSTAFLGDAVIVADPAKRTDVDAQLK